MAIVSAQFGLPVLVCAPDGPDIDVAAATDLIGEALGAEVDWVLIPATRLGPGFFTLRTGVAGEIAQKFVNYRLKLAIVGDIAAYVADSNALRDFVYESNRGRNLWFLPTEAALEDRLAGHSG